MQKCKTKISSLLRTADVAIGGDRPWDIHIKNDQFYSRLLAEGSLALGESYMDAWWDCPQLDEFIYKALRADLEKSVTPLSHFFDVFYSKIRNFQSKARSFHVGKHHYDIGNDLYRGMLDKYMIYSCGYWKNASCLDDAQEAKLELTCRKLHLEPGMKVLDIGCGWGGMAKFAAENYDVKVTGITVSKEQAKHAEAICNGLDVEILVQDYRELKGKYDRIVSLGMFEHVGCKNYRTFMRVARRLLENDGLFLLHTIGNNKSVSTTEKWINRYIFPNSMIPSAKQIAHASEGFFIIEDWHSFGSDYDRTLMHWFDNFNRHWETIRDRYGERFYRMWKYYLLSCAGSFRARKKQLWQIVYSVKGCDGGYHCVR